MYKALFMPRNFMSEFPTVWILTKNIYNIDSWVTKAIFSNPVVSPKVFSHLCCSQKNWTSLGSAKSSFEFSSSSPKQKISSTRVRWKIIPIFLKLRRKFGGREKKNRVLSSEWKLRQVGKSCQLFFSMVPKKRTSVKNYH